MDYVILEKAHKYIKREGTPGNYVYWYPEDVNKPGFPGKETPREPVELKHFQVDDKLIMHSPHTEEDTIVNYRGPGESGKSVVWTGRTQIQVPTDWLSEKPVEKEVATPTPETADLPLQKQEPEKERGQKLTQLKTEEQRVKYLSDLADEVNKKYFGGKLKVDRIRLLKMMGRTTRLGEYDPLTGVIGITPRYFLNDGNKEELRKTLIHELCHKAAREIDGQSPHEGNPHGYVWRNWMRRCGLRPDVVHKGELDLLSEKEKEVREAKKEREEKAKEGAKELSTYDLKEKKIVKFNNGGKWVVGVLVGPMKSDFGRWLMAVGGKRWWKVPVNKFFDVTPEEEEPIKSRAEGWYTEVKESLQERQGRRRERSVFRRLGSLGRY